MATIGVAAATPVARADEVFLDTRSGRAVGTSDGAVSRFLGIPYAAPPTRGLRFRPPAPHAPWTMPLLATAYGHACPQGSALDMPSSDEDCLTLNVFRPIRGGASRPILVFLYGGSFRYGSAVAGNGDNGPNYDASRIAERTGAIVVTVNYRLGVLGFLASPALDAADPRGVSGNYGLLDQQAALRWIRDNARAMGGDPARIALFGQSAGALSIAEQLISPSARGLFSAALLESPGAPPTETLGTAEIRDAPILSATGCAGAADQAACLRAVPVATLLKSDVSIGPAIDGVVLPGTVDKALADGRYFHVPTSVLTDADEGTYFIAAAAAAKGHAVTADEYLATLAKAFGSANAPTIAAAYPASVAGTPGQALSAVLTDEFFSCPAVSLHRALARHVASRQFEFAQPDPVHDYPVPAAPGIETRDAHTTELAYLFGHDGADRPLVRPAGRALSDGMIDLLGVLASNRAPRVTVGQGDDVISLATPPAISADFSARHHCGLWSSLGVAPKLIDSID